MQTAAAIVIAGLLVAGAMLWIGRYEPIHIDGGGLVVLDRLRGELRICEADHSKSPPALKCRDFGAVGDSTN